MSMSFWVPWRYFWHPKLKSAWFLNIELLSNANLYHYDEGSGRASVKAWVRKFPPQPLGKLSAYLWSAPTEADARERMVDLDELQSYLGSKIAFYVSFLSVLCAWQCVIAIPAIAFTVLQIMYGLQVRLVLWNVVLVAAWVGLVPFTLCCSLMPCLC
jgi:hypothetical protein